MSIDDNVKLVSHVMDDFLRTGSPEALLAAISEDAEMKAVIADGTPISGTFRGREGILRYLEARADRRASRRQGAEDGAPGEPRWRGGARMHDRRGPGHR
jgi:hypothetical protein